MNNKIEDNLNASELADFVRKCAELPGLTLAKIQSLAGDYGIDVSLMAARSFKKKNYAAHIKNIQSAQQAATEIAALAQTGAGDDINEASATLLSMEVFKALNEAISEGGEIPLGEISKVIARLRLGDQRGKYLEARLKEYEDKAEEREEAKKKLKQTISKARSSKNGISKETLALIQEEVGLL